MSQPPASRSFASVLPAARAFAVHFRAVHGRGRRFAGRVEHLSSGTCAEFRSLRGLLAFFTERLEPPEDAR